MQRIYRDISALIQSYNAATNSANQYGIITIISTLAWGLGYFGMPHILLRFMAIDDPENVKLSRRIASTWVVISMAAAILIGIIGFSMSTEGILGAYGSFDSETIIVQISTVISKHGFIFAIVAGIILAGILASTMSTSDSQLLAASSSVTENMLDGVFGIKLSEKKKVVVARATVIVISIIAIFLASNIKVMYSRLYLSHGQDLVLPSDLENAVCIILETFKQVGCHCR